MGLDEDKLILWFEKYFQLLILHSELYGPSVQPLGDLVVEAAEISELECQHRFLLL